MSISTKIEDKFRTMSEVKKRRDNGSGIVLFDAKKQYKDQQVDVVLMYDKETKELVGTTKDVFDTPKEYWVLMGYIN